MTKSMIFRLSQKLNSKIKAGALTPFARPQPVCGLVGSPFRRESDAVHHFEQHEGALLVRHVRCRNYE